MARKKTEAKPMPTATASASAGTKPVRLDLPADVHRLLRLVSAHADQSMASYARHILASALRDDAKRKGIRP
jgi:plasmid stability protein